MKFWTTKTGSDIVGEAVTPSLCLHDDGCHTLLLLDPDLVRVSECGGLSGATRSYSAGGCPGMLFQLAAGGTCRGHDPTLNHVPPPARAPVAALPLNASLHYCCICNRSCTYLSVDYRFNIAANKLLCTHPASH